MEQVQNNQLILVSGYSSTGKSSSLRNLREPEKWMYLNCEGKLLPFRSKFQEYKISDPYQVYEAFDYATDPSNDIAGIIVDSLTYLMDMFETNYVQTASDTRKAWAEYGNFFRTLMFDKVVKFNKDTIFLAHVLDTTDETDLSIRTQVPIKGALKAQGVESFFSTVVSTKRKNIKDLKDYDNKMLTITEDEELDGFKYVFQTRIDKKSINERIRSPMGMFSRKETFVDNDCQMLLDHLREYYNN